MASLILYLVLFICLDFSFSPLSLNIPLCPNQMYQVPHNLKNNNEEDRHPLKKKNNEDRHAMLLLVIFFF